MRSEKVAAQKVLDTGDRLLQLIDSLKIRVEETVAAEVRKLVDSAYELLQLLDSLYLRDCCIIESPSDLFALQGKYQRGTLYQVENVYQMGTLYLMGQTKKSLSYKMLLTHSPTKKFAEGSIPWDQMPAGFRDKFKEGVPEGSFFNEIQNWVFNDIMLKAIKAFPVGDEKYLSVEQLQNYSQIYSWMAFHEIPNSSTNFGDASQVSSKAMEYLKFGISLAVKGLEKLERDPKSADPEDYLQRKMSLMLDIVSFHQTAGDIDNVIKSITCFIEAFNDVFGSAVPMSLYRAYMAMRIKYYLQSTIPDAMRLAEEDCLEVLRRRGGEAADAEGNYRSIGLLLSQIYLLENRVKEAVGVFLKECEPFVKDGGSNEYKVQCALLCFGRNREIILSYSLESCFQIPDECTKAFEALQDVLVVRINMMDDVVKILRVILPEKCASSFIGELCKALIHRKPELEQHPVLVNACPYFNNNCSTTLSKR